MAVRLYSREHVEQELWKRYCRKVRDYGTHALWKTNLGFHFTVPREGPLEQCDEYTFRRILKDVEAHSEFKKR